MQRIGLYVHKGDLKPYSFHLYVVFTMCFQEGCLSLCEKMCLLCIFWCGSLDDTLCIILFVVSFRRVNWSFTERPWRTRPLIPLTRHTSSQKTVTSAHTAAEAALNPAPIAALVSMTTIAMTMRGVSTYQMA